MKKGFFFSYDTFLALTISALLIFGTSYSLSKSGENSYTKFQLSKQANDILIVLDKNETLSTLDQTKIQNALQNILPQQLDGSLKVSVYSFSGNFQLSSTIIANDPTGIAIPLTGDVGYARRLFVTFANKKINQYAVAELWVWLA